MNVLLGNMIFALIFAILGFFLLFLHVPKDESLIYYKSSRIVLGLAFLIMTLYCCLRPTILEPFGEFTELCFLMFFSLIFSWLNYSTFLLLIYAENFKRRRFFLDGIIPVSLMLIFAVIGLKHPHLQKINSIIFTIIFGAKCLWMAYTCLNEYKKVLKDLNNYYEEAPDITWMRTLIYLTILLSILTIVSFYVPVIHLVYDPFAMAIYFYMTFKLVNYFPVKISMARQESVEYKEEKTNRVSPDLKNKLEPSVNRWVESKKFMEQDITIKDVATDIGTNHNYLSKYLNSVIGMTFSVWLHTLRIDESKKLLVGPDKLSIEDIGKRVGIPEIYNFSRWFKNLTGVTPQQYRKSNK